MVCLKLVYDCLHLHSRTTAIRVANSVQLLFALRALHYVFKILKIVFWLCVTNLNTPAHIWHFRLIKNRAHVNPATLLYSMLPTPATSF